MLERANRIASYAERISGISAVIEGIARETNILVLNAAVEAARAGDAGKGFAVVAAAVRNLAQQSAMAAREIEQLTGTSVEEVRLGVEAVTSARPRMNRILSSVDSLAEVVQTISTSAKEQHMGIEEANRSIAYIDEATQNNVTLVDDVAQVANRLRNQSTQLSVMVEGFCIEST